MKHTSIPPFYVGQEVVAVRNQPDGDFKKGDTFKVTSCFFGCCSWEVTVGIYDTNFESICNICSGGISFYGKHEAPYHASAFAPITSTFQPITLEKVLEEETKLIGVN